MGERERDDYDWTIILRKPSQHARRYCGITSPIIPGPQGSRTNWRRVLGWLGRLDLKYVFPFFRNTSGIVWWSPISLAFDETLWWWLFFFLLLKLGLLSMFLHPWLSQDLKCTYSYQGISFYLKKKKKQHRSHSLVPERAGEKGLFSARDLVHKWKLSLGLFKP